MNAQDNHFDPIPQDADLLASIDRVLTHPESVTHRDPHSFEQFSADLAAATPHADPAFRELLGRRLASAIEQRQERTGAVSRLRSFVPRSPSRHSWLPRLWQAARWRLASLMLAVLIAAGGIGAYLHGQGPTPVNAQTVLHRAQAASPGPNEAVHSTYRLSAGGGVTGTADVWVAADGSGAPTQFALTLTMLKDGKPAPDLNSRLVQTDQAFQVYDPATNTVTITSQGRPVRHPATSYSSSTSVQDLEGMLVGTLIAQKLSRALGVGSQQNAFKLQQQTLDGVSVYALKLDHLESQTFYFNTQSYVLEGTDWVQAGRSWQARLDRASYHTMALSAVPPNTFTLNAPTTARVVTIAAPKDGSGTTRRR